MNEPETLISVLQEDHNDLRQLLTELGYLIEFERLRRSVTQLLIAEMVRHAVAEETYMYPVARTRLPQGTRIVERENAGHAELERVLRRMDLPDLTSAEFSTLLVELNAEAGPHARAEERQLFPMLAEYLTPEELVAVGKKAAEAKEKASLRQYLADPDCSLRGRLVTSGTTMVERVRVYLRGGAYPL
ncbi:hemerythrin domain-containing protein [Actinoallomurus sp. NPDC052274]|uniref:hemerythrin domain-containing protein n=1 Tax=Actinoallomurus sp. NPDC052274 TaxID=3155420 RepID=UPI003444606E